MVIEFASPKQVHDSVRAAVELLGPDLLKSRYPHAQGVWMEEILASFEQHLISTGADSLSSALSTFEGKTAIPIMTIHKSKGLEYHTVVFLGLEDGAFFNFKTESSESLSEFFVAFSRAKKTVVFTYAATRTGTRYPEQFRDKIGPLYELLSKAGVKAHRLKKIDSA